MLDPGELDLRVTFFRPSVVENGLGERVPDGGREIIARVMAKRSSVRDGERNDGRQVQREVSDRFVTHWAQALAVLDLTEQLAVTEDGIEVVYDLVGRKPVEGRRVAFEWSANARPQMVEEDPA